MGGDEPLAAARDCAAFLADGIAVEDGFLSPRRVHGLIETATRRRLRGEFKAARVGAPALLQTVRGDSTCWLEAPLFDEERALLEDLERLRLDLNRAALLGLFELEAHYAWYPPGAGYARHVDQLRGRAQRRVSIIVYLNEAWVAGDGGELRVFGAGAGYHDIEPIAGRLVYFASAGREHAVLPTARERLSITGWLRTRE